MPLCQARSRTPRISLNKYPQSWTLQSSWESKETCEHGMVSQTPQGARPASTLPILLRACVCVHMCVCAYVYICVQCGHTDPSNFLTSPLLPANSQPPALENYNLEELSMGHT